MKKKLDSDEPGAANLDQLIEEITVDAHGDDEQLWAFRQAFEDSIGVPCDGFVIGEPVSVVAFEAVQDGLGRAPRREVTPLGKKTKVQRCFNGA